MRRLAQFCIYVFDLQRSEAFYTEVLGLKVEQRLQIPNAKEIILAGSDGDTRIQLAQALPKAEKIEHGNALWKIYLYCDDCQDLYDKAVAGGAKAVSEPVKLEQWPVTVAFIKDPDGYLIQLLQRHQ